MQSYDALYIFRHCLDILDIYDANGEISGGEIFLDLSYLKEAGGVIKGPGRLDVFCRAGEDAEILAGSLKERG